MGSYRLGKVQFGVTRGSGTFAFDGLHAGEYRLRSGNYVRSDPTEELVVVEGILVPGQGSAPKIEVTLPLGATLDVIAVDAGQAPLAGRKTDVVSEGGGRRSSSTTVPRIAGVRCASRACAQVPSPRSW